MLHRTRIWDVRPSTRLATWSVLGGQPRLCSPPPSSLQATTVEAAGLMTSTVVHPARREKETLQERATVQRGAVLPHQHAQSTQPVQ